MEGRGQKRKGRGTAGEVSHGGRKRGDAEGLQRKVRTEARSARRLTGSVFLEF